MYCIYTWILFCTVLYMSFYKANKDDYYYVAGFEKRQFSPSDTQLNHCAGIQNAKYH